MKKYINIVKKRTAEEGLKKVLYDIILLLSGFFILFMAIFMVWFSSLKLPSFEDFEARKVSNSTKIYDRTGGVLLYSVHNNIKRTVVPYDKISVNLKNAIVAIEDRDFYNHNGIKISSIIRGVLKTFTGDTQGGSTITQQVIKNTVLSNEKTVTRKIKEWILATKLEKNKTKDEILAIYLNEMPFGGSIYGVEEASLSYFNEKASEVTVAQAAYIAALPQAPSRYSPYGKHKDELDARKNLVLLKMYEQKYLNESEYEQAKNEQVVFEPQSSFSGKAFHFSLLIKQYLEDKYGEDVVENGGLKVITTLDWEIQKKAEDVVKKYALMNKEKFNAENAALVAVDPKSGQVLSMVGSRDYFDDKIDGKVNITTSKRQPGSSFKPLVYATAFEKGYTPETVLFDVPTEFNVNCPAIVTDASPSTCYNPVNYDGKFRGPVSIRGALAQSLNVPAVKVLYLTGLGNVLDKAREMGITTLRDKNRYGLTLVLGGGEVTLLELTGAYATFANKGSFPKQTNIISVTDKDGNVLEKYEKRESSVFSENTVNKLISIMTDNEARIPAFGANSPLYFGGRPVAVKTGTTNDYHDVWTVGFTPSVVVGVWGGNNDNRAIDKKAAGSVISPMWRAFMDEYFKTHPEVEYFDNYTSDDIINPILNGRWCSSTSPLASILYYIDKENPSEFSPGRSSDPQFYNWQKAIESFSSNSSCPFSESDFGGTVISDSISSEILKTDEENYQNQNNTTSLIISNEKPLNFYVTGLNDSYYENDLINLSVYDVNSNINKATFSINGKLNKTVSQKPLNITFTPSEENLTPGNYTLNIEVESPSLETLSRSLTIKIK